MLLLYETWFIILMLIICPPFGMILMVKNSFWDKKTQIIAGIASVILFVGILLGTIAVVKLISNREIQPNEPGTTVVTEPTQSTQPTPVATEPSETTSNPSTEGTTPTEEATPPTETTTPTPSKTVSTTSTPSTTPIEETGKKEDYTLSADQISKLSESEKYSYLLGKELYSNKTISYKISMKSVTPSKFDVTIEDTSNSGANILEELKTICEKIHKLNYKPKTMQVVLKISKEIATIEDYSSEILSNVQCSIFENNELTRRSVIISVN